MDFGIYSADQLTLRQQLILSGNSIGGTSSGSGFLFGLGYNLANNKQYWMGDPDYIGNSGSTFARVITLNGYSVLNFVDGANGAAQPVAIGTNGLVSGSPNDYLRVIDATHPYMAQYGTSADANVAQGFNQGNLSSTAGNGFYAQGIVGTTTDGFFGMSNTASGRNSGDFIQQTYFGGGFKNIYYVAVGTNNLIFTAPFGSKTTTVGSLPAAGNAGRRFFVTDATVTTFASVVAGGGANGVPVYDDGTNWRIG
jgi:hypothetical protein